MRIRHASVSNLPSAAAVSSARWGISGGAVRLGEEAREMLADDLVGLVALEAPRTRIPGGDAPVGIDHVDGIIGDRADQQLETILGSMGIEVEVIGHLVSIIAGPEATRPFATRP